MHAVAVGALLILAAVLTSPTTPREHSGTILDAGAPNTMLDVPVSKKASCTISQYTVVCMQGMPVFATCGPSCSAYPSMNMTFEAPISATTTLMCTAVTHQGTDHCQEHANYTVRRATVSVQAADTPQSPAEYCCYQHMTASLPLVANCS